MKNIYELRKFRTQHQELIIKDEWGIKIKDLGFKIEQLDMAIVGDIIKPILEAIITSATLDSLKPKDDEVIRLYRYEVRPGAGELIQHNSRDFCRALLSGTRDRLFTLEDVKNLDNANPGFGYHGASNYNVLKYSGGPNCRHQWVAYTYEDGVLEKDFIQPETVDMRNWVRLT